MGVTKGNKATEEIGKCLNRECSGKVLSKIWTNLLPVILIECSFKAVCSSVKTLFTEFLTLAFEVCLTDRTSWVLYHWSGTQGSISQTSAFSLCWSQMDLWGCWGSRCPHWTPCWSPHPYCTHRRTWTHAVKRNPLLFSSDKHTAYILYM